MSVPQTRVRLSPPNITPRSSGASGPGGSVFDMPGDTHLALATIGSGDGDLWARIEGSKALVEMTLESGSIDDDVVVEVERKYLGRLAPGQLVLLGFVNGDPNNSYLIGIVDVVDAGLPDEVCGVQTGAALAGDVDAPVPPIVPMPLFTFEVTRKGRLWALQTGERGDVLVHSGAGMELKASTGVFVKSSMSVGFGFATPPIGAVAGVEDVEDGEIPGVPGVPPPPNIIENLTDPPYVGDQDAVVRAKDAYQSTAGVDPEWWAYQEAKAIYHEALVAFTLVIAAGNLPDIAAATTVFNAAKAAFDALTPPTKLSSAAVTASQALRAADNVAP